MQSVKARKEGIEGVYSFFLVQSVPSRERTYQVYFDYFVWLSCRGAVGLFEDLIADACGKKNIAIGNRKRCIFDY